MEAWVSWAADVASIASFFISLYVAWQVRGIKHRFVKRVAVTAFIEQLRGHLVFLSDALEPAIFDPDSLAIELAKCEANLKSAAPHLQGHLRRDARRAISVIMQGRPDPMELYVIMIRLLRGLENLEAEKDAESYVD